jgi:hypothetical protein
MGAPAVLQPSARRQRQLSTGLLLALLMAGCGGGGGGGDETSTAAPAPPPPPPPSADELGLLTDAEVAAMSGLPRSTVAAVDPRRSLMVTDQAVLAPFSFDALMQRLASQSTLPLTRDLLFNQWFDTNNRKPGLSLGPHCDDTVDAAGQALFNDFAITCPRAEGSQSAVTAFDPASGNSYVPIALANRFDLAVAPQLGGDDCGEYRIVFAKKSGMTDRLNRNLVVFEGVLPNPAPNGRDLSGCVPAIRFWADLSQEPDPVKRGQKLHDFYFTGLPGFQPVVRAAAYGNGSSKAKGQIRSNQFMQQNWLLRQYTLQDEGGMLRIKPAPSHANPEGLLFNETVSHAKSADFRQAFVRMVPSLAKGDLHRITLHALPSTFWAWDSDAQDPMKSNYSAQFASSPQFTASLQSALTAAGSSLTPADIVARAQTQSCAGCHQLSNGKDLGGGLVWPSSLGFVHVAEDRTEPSPDGPAGSLRFLISPALIDVYLPARKHIMETFLGGVSAP